MAAPSDLDWLRYRWQDRALALQANPEAAEQAFADVVARYTRVLTMAEAPNQ